MHLLCLELCLHQQKLHAGKHGADVLNGVALGLELYGSPARIDVDAWAEMEETVSSANQHAHGHLKRGHVIALEDMVDAKAGGVGFEEPLKMYHLGDDGLDFILI